VSARLWQELGDGQGWWVTYALLNVSHVAVDQGQYSSARAALVETVSRWSELGNRATLARLLEASAQLPVATSRHVEALRLAGAAERLPATVGGPASAAERRRSARAGAKVRRRQPGRGEPTQRRDPILGPPVLASGRANGVLDLELRGRCVVPASGGRWCDAAG
jgi:hypothetical protein